MTSSSLTVNSSVGKSIGFPIPSTDSRWPFDDFVHSAVAVLLVVAGLASSTSADAADWNCWEDEVSKDVEEVMVVAVEETVEKREGGECCPEPESEQAEEWPESGRSIASTTTSAHCPPVAQPSLR